jgi:hypothetical protein
MFALPTRWRKSTNLARGCLVSGNTPRQRTCSRNAPPLDGGIHTDLPNNNSNVCGRPPTIPGVQGGETTKRLHAAPVVVGTGVRLGRLSLLLDQHRWLAADGCTWSQWDTWTKQTDSAERSAEAPHSDKHVILSHPQHCPYSPEPKKYGSEAQSSFPIDTTRPLGDKEIKAGQKIVGSVLYYAQAINMTVC